MQQMGFRQDVRKIGEVQREEPQDLECVEEVIVTVFWSQQVQTAQ